MDMAVKDQNLRFYCTCSMSALAPLCQGGNTINKTLGEGQGAS